MPVQPSNVFEVGEEVDVVIKRNETWRRGFLLEEPDPSDPTGKAFIPIDLTGATIVGGLKKSYDDPTLLAAVTVYGRDDASGVFFVKLDLGIAGGKLSAAPWDVVVVLASGQKIRAGAGMAQISQGVAGVTP